MLSILVEVQMTESLNNFPLSPSGEALNEAERVARVQELEKHYHLSSDSVIESAKVGTLPPSPHFVEWLVLLGRGDLV